MSTGKKLTKVTLHGLTLGEVLLEHWQ